MHENNKRGIQLESCGNRLNYDIKMDYKGREYAPDSR